jgi:hypothetical protein
MCNVMALSPWHQYRNTILEKDKAGMKIKLPIAGVRQGGISAWCRGSVYRKAFYNHPQQGYSQI